MIDNIILGIYDRCYLEFKTFLPSKNRLYFIIL